MQGLCFLLPLSCSHQSGRHSAANTGECRLVPLPPPCRPPHLHACVVRVRQEVVVHGECVRRQVGQEPGVLLHGRKKAGTGIIQRQHVTSDRLRPGRWHGPASPAPRSPCSTASDAIAVPVIPCAAARPRGRVPPTHAVVRPVYLPAPMHAPNPLPFDPAPASPALKTAAAAMPCQAAIHPPPTHAHPPTWICAMVRRCRGSPTSSLHSRSRHSGDTSTSAGMLHSMRRMRCIMLSMRALPCSTRSDRRVAEVG